MLLQQLASAASARRGCPASLEEAGAYLDLAGGDVTAALLEMCDDAAWESRAKVAHAFPARTSSAAAAAGSGSGSGRGEFSGGAFGVSSGGGGGGGGGGGPSLMTRLSSAVAAVGGGGGGGGGGEKRD
jgi:hypothetical protein